MRRRGSAKRQRRRRPASSSSTHHDSPFDSIAGCETGTVRARSSRRGAMRYFLDTEYNGFGGALLSLALVPEDGGEEFYVTLDCMTVRSIPGSSATSCPSSTWCRKGCKRRAWRARAAAEALAALAGARRGAGDRRRLARGSGPTVDAAGHRPGPDGRRSRRSPCASCRCTAFRPPPTAPSRTMPFTMRARFAIIVMNHLE